MAFNLFKRDYNKPGPGVPKNAPRKRGAARYFEILTRDFSHLIKINLLHQLCLLPAQALFVLAFLFSRYFAVFMAASILASIPVGPSLTAMLLLQSKMLRDEPGFVWHDYKKAFRENFRKTVVPGMLYFAVIAAQLYAALLYYTQLSSIGIPLLAIFGFSIILFWMAARYFFLQAGYLELGILTMLKNSLLLALGNAPRSLIAALITLVFGVGQILLAPSAVPVTVFFGYALPSLWSLMVIWPPVNKVFKIEETLKERAEKKLAEQQAADA